MEGKSGVKSACTLRDILSSCPLGRQLLYFLVYTHKSKVLCRDSNFSICIFFLHSKCNNSHKAAWNYQCCTNIIMPPFTVKKKIRVFVTTYTPLQKKRNAWFRGSHAQRLGPATEVRNFIHGSNSRALPLLTISDPPGAADLIRGAWKPLNQALRFFWRGV